MTFLRTGVRSLVLFALCGNFFSNRSISYSPLADSLRSHAFLGQAYRRTGTIFLFDDLLASDSPRCLLSPPRKPEMTAFSSNFYMFLYVKCKQNRIRRTYAPKEITANVDYRLVFFVKFMAKSRYLHLTHKNVQKLDF